MFGSVDIVLVTENAGDELAIEFLARSVFDLPDSHTRTRNGWELDGTRETLITLRIIVLEANLQLDGFEEVTLLLVQRIVKKILDILSDSCDRDF